MARDGVITYIHTPRDWLPTERPAILVWGTLTALPCFLAIQLARSTSMWWLLLLIPTWLWPGQKIAGIMRFLIRGREEVTLLLPEVTGSHFGASLDGGRSVTPVHGALLEDIGRAWLITGNGGAYHFVIPKHAVSDEEGRLIVERLGGSGGPPTS